jgi:CBS domain-containing protein
LPASGSNSGALRATFPERLFAQEKNNLSEERRKKMKVENVMTKSPAYCSRKTNLAEAVEILWNYNCGALPIVDSQERVVGLITDRDICIALGTRNRLPADISVADVASDKVFCTRPEDDLHKAIQTMTEAGVRRLPVIDATGKLQGILSMDDIVLHADATGIRRDSEISSKDVVNTLQSIYAFRIRPAERPKKAAAA